MKNKDLRGAVGLLQEEEYGWYSTARRRAGREIRCSDPIGRWSTQLSDEHGDGEGWTVDVLTVEERKSVCGCMS